MISIPSTNLIRFRSCFGLESIFRKKKVHIQERVKRTAIACPTPILGFLQSFFSSLHSKGVPMVRRTMNSYYFWSIAITLKIAELFFSLASDPNASTTELLSPIFLLVRSTHSVGVVWTRLPSPSFGQTGPPDLWRLLRKFFAPTQLNMWADVRQYQIVVILLCIKNVFDWFNSFTFQAKKKKECYGKKS